MSNVNSFFHLTARQWNSLPAECFSLTSDLNDFKSRVNRHLDLCLFSFSNDLPLNVFHSGGRREGGGDSQIVSNAMLKLLNRYYFGRCSFELAEPVSFPLCLPD